MTWITVGIAGLFTVEVCHIFPKLAPLKQGGKKGLRSVLLPSKKRQFRWLSVSSSAWCCWKHPLRCGGCGFPKVFEVLSHYVHKLCGGIVLLSITLRWESDWYEVEICTRIYWVQLVVSGPFRKVDVGENTRTGKATIHWKKSLEKSNPLR